MGADIGWVSGGRDHDTAAFAVTTLRRWWQAMGQPLYTDADRLLVCADGGGSNGYRNRADGRRDNKLERFLQRHDAHHPQSTAMALHCAQPGPT